MKRTFLKFIAMSGLALCQSFGADFPDDADFSALTGSASLKTGKYGIQHGGYGSLEKSIHDFIANSPRKVGLEIGAGRGRLAKDLYEQHLNLRLFVNDEVSENLDTLRAWWKGDGRKLYSTRTKDNAMVILQGDFETLLNYIQPLSLDFIVCLNVAQFLGPAKLLRLFEITRFLKPGGQLFFASEIDRQFPDKMLRGINAMCLQDYRDSINPTLSKPKRDKAQAKLDNFKLMFTNPQLHSLFQTVSKYTIHQVVEDTTNVIFSVKSHLYRQFNEQKGIKFAGYFQKEQGLLDLTIVEPFQSWIKGVDRNTTHLLSEDLLTEITRTLELETVKAYYFSLPKGGSWIEGDKGTAPFYGFIARKLANFTDDDLFQSEGWLNLKEAANLTLGQLKNLHQGFKFIVTDQVPFYAIVPK